MPGRGSRTLGFVEIAAASLIWGSNGVIITVLPLSSYVIAFFRVTIASFTIALGILASGRWGLFKPSYPKVNLIILGILLCLGWGLLFEAMKRLPVAEAVLLNYTAPVFVALLATRFLGERASRRTIAALILSFAGIALILFSDSSAAYERHLFGVLIGISAGASYAVFVILSKKAVARVNNYTLTLYSNLLASLFLAPGLVTLNQPPPAQAWLLLITLGAMNTAFAVSLYFRGLQKVQAQEAAVLTYLEPVSTALFGLLFLGQALKPAAITGGALVLAGGYLVASRRQEENQAAK
ncbi:MAG: DMT family transporter [Candidatus Bathyarchaeia archaeon]